MPTKKKGKKKTHLTQSSTSEIKDTFDSPKKKNSKLNSKNNAHSRSKSTKNVSKKKGTKHNKAKSKTQNKTKSPSKTQKKTTKPRSVTNASASARKVSNASSGSSKTKSKAKVTVTSPVASPKKSTETPKKKKFPWANWFVDRDDGNSNNNHHQRRSSLGSIRELHVQRAKEEQARGPSYIANFDEEDDEPNYGYDWKKEAESKDKDSEFSKKKKRKKSKSRKKKKHKMGISGDDHGFDIYNPDSKKEARRREKEKKEFKVIPKHHIKRSSLPTYQSMRKNNPKLQMYVKKETNRNLALLLDQPEKRKKSVQLKNLSRNGFEIHVNHRYRLEDGRIGVCKYKGRTEFGKTSEDWIGLVLDVGKGEHDGSVQGKVYFRCRDGKGLFVRPFDIVQDMGSHTKELKKEDKKLAKAHMKRWAMMKGGAGTTTSTDILKEKQEEDLLINPDHGYDMNQEKFYNPKTILDKNKGKKAKKKKNHRNI